MGIHQRALGRISDIKYQRGCRTYHNVFEVVGRHQFHLLVSSHSSGVEVLSLKALVIVVVCRHSFHSTLPRQKFHFYFLCYIFLNSILLLFIISFQIISSFEIHWNLFIPFIPINSSFHLSHSGIFLHIEFSCFFSIKLFVFRSLLCLFQCYRTARDCVILFCYSRDLNC